MPQKSRKTLKYLHLTDSIAKFGFDVMPYSFCKGKGFRYKIIERSSRYAECTRRGRSYNASGTAIAHYILFSSIFSGIFMLIFLLVPHLGREADRLEQAEETTEIQLLRAQQKVNKAIIRLSRIYRQKRLLRERGI
jgi:hypothetical protein